MNWKSANQIKPVNAEITREDVVIPWAHYEPAGGLYKWDGLYYTSGQNALRGRAALPWPRRAFLHLRGFQKLGGRQRRRFRSHRPSMICSGLAESRDGEQTHEGISVWNRNNVLLGVYGIWHGDLEWRGVSIDLGFVVSNDGS